MMRLPDYFVMKNDPRIAHKPAVLQIDLLKKPFHELPPVQVLEARPDPAMEAVDWIADPVPLYSDALKNIAEKYNIFIRFKKVYIVDPSSGNDLVYWLADYPSVDVLSPATEYHVHDGSVKRLVLDRGKLRGHHIVQIRGPRRGESYLAISLHAAESFLRRGLSGFVLEKTELDGGYAL
ncbi:hypothetical protein LMZ02_22485 [Paenibacillus macerans]|nr:hypothetical protein [Paenibacillus macerans]MED4954063.1 hypothetical protein [Paenibacillus macerans]UMV46232.1 hypothetical protein LMZ02_22485 [Paenibacillus macerans]